MQQRSSSTFYEPFLPPSKPLDTPPTLGTANREASGREMALLRDLNGGFAQSKPPPPQLRQPRLHGDHAQRIAKLDEEIYERGIAVDRERLLSLGKARFKQLLATERLARSERAIGTRCDLSEFGSVLFTFSQAGALQNMPVPAPTMHEQLVGADVPLDAARKVDGWIDLWKLYGTEPRAVRAVYAFHDQFAALVFGQSLFTWLEKSGRVHHEFFARGSGDKVRLFEPWMPALKTPHYRINICNSLQALIFWLAGETSAPPKPLTLAQNCFGVRAPSPEQITFAGALFEGFLLGHKGWPLWQHIGRATRTLPDKSIIESYSEQLRKRYSKVLAFHQELAAAFYKRRGDHNEFEPARHRQFINVTLAQLRNCVSAVAALCVEENYAANAAPIVARFRDQIMCTGKPKPQLAERIGESLQAAFPGSAFSVEVAA